MDLLNHFKQLRINMLNRLQISKYYSFLINFRWFELGEQMIWSQAAGYMNWPEIGGKVGYPEWFEIYIQVVERGRI